MGGVDAGEGGGPHGGVVRREWTWRNAEQSKARLKDKCVPKQEWRRTLQVTQEWL